MTIKEMEERSGMVRANIRYYEAEGLLAPERAANGYRNYSEHDLEVLLRIKLLRTLHMTIEEIKALQVGERRLEEALQTHMKSLGQEELHLQRSQVICREICEDKADYATLDAPKYLAAMELLEKNGAILPEPSQPEDSKMEAFQSENSQSAVSQAGLSTSQTNTARKEELLSVLGRAAKERAEQAKQYQPEYLQDQLPPFFVPWRRYFARTLDLAIYQLLLLALAVHFVSPTRIAEAQGLGWSVLGYVIDLLVLLLVEPVLIATLKTTPGKWLLGLKVTNPHGGRLSYSDALERTWKVFWYGMGGSIPIYIWIRNYKSYESYLAGETLDWEVNSSLEIREERFWTSRKRSFVQVARVVGYFLVLTALLGTVVFSCLEAAMPKHRGDITVEQFSENGNAYMEYFGLDKRYRLDKDGNWIEVQTEDPNVIVVEVGPGGQPLEHLDFAFTEENGVLTGVSMETTMEMDYIPFAYLQDMALAVHSFVRARKEVPLTGGEITPIVRLLETSQPGDFTITAYGVTVSLEVSPVSGEGVSGGGRYRLRFVIEKER